MQCQLGHGQLLKVKHLLTFLEDYFWEDSLKVKFPNNKGEDEPKPGITPATEIPAPAWKPEVVAFGFLLGTAICDVRWQRPIENRRPLSTLIQLAGEEVLR